MSEVSELGAGYGALSAPSCTGCSIDTDSLPASSFFALISRTQRSIRFDGIGVLLIGEELEADGRRNGRAPVGEA